MKRPKPIPAYSDWKKPSDFDDAVFLFFVSAGAFRTFSCPARITTENDLPIRDNDF